MDADYLTREATDISDIAGVSPIKTRTYTCDIPKFNNTVWLSSPTMHGDELKYMTEAYEQNWMSTVGANINAVERMACEHIGCKYAVALTCGTAALHLAIRLASVKHGSESAGKSIRASSKCKGGCRCKPLRYAGKTG